MSNAHILTRKRLRRVGAQKMVTITSRFKMTDNPDFRSKDHLASRMAVREALDAERDKKLDAIPVALKSLSDEISYLREQVAKLTEWRKMTHAVAGAVGGIVATTATFLFHK